MLSIGVERGEPRNEPFNQDNAELPKGWSCGIAYLTYTRQLGLDSLAQAVNMVMHQASHLQPGQPSAEAVLGCLPRPWFPLSFHFLN